MKTFKLLIVLALIICCKNTMAQRTSKESSKAINIILIDKIKEEADSLYKKDTYLNKHNLKPVYVLYIDKLSEHEKSFVFSMTTMLNDYELISVNASHKFCFSDKILIIRYNHKTINQNLINEVFEKIAENEINKLSKILSETLLKSTGGKEVVGLSYAVVHTYKNGENKEKWYDDRNTLPLELDYLYNDDEFINHYNDSIRKTNKR